MCFDDCIIEYAAFVLDVVHQQVTLKCLNLEFYLTLHKVL